MKKFIWGVVRFSIRVYNFYFGYTLLLLFSEFGVLTSKIYIYGNMLEYGSVHM